MQTKLDAKSVPTILVGYDEQSKAYCCYNPITRKILISPDVVVDEYTMGNFYPLPTQHQPSTLDILSQDTYSSGPSSGPLLPLAVSNIVLVNTTPSADNSPPSLVAVSSHDSSPPDDSSPPADDSASDSPDVFPFTYQRQRQRPHKL